jgi:hypothetical protein
LTETLQSFRPALIRKYREYLQAEAEIFASVLENNRSAFENFEQNPKLTARILILSTNALLPLNFSTREIGRRRDVIEETIVIADFLLQRGLHAGAA